MISPSALAPDAESRAPSPATLSPTRPLYWSIRRELWENRSLYIAPLAAAALVLVIFVLRLPGLSGRVSDAIDLDSFSVSSELARPYHFAAFLILITSVIVSIFYSLEALHGERSDRSILFWKSLPVSDLTTVLAKASIPVVIQPLIVLVIIVATQLVMLVLSSGVLLVHGRSAAELWQLIPWIPMTIGLVYVLLVMALWFVPLYGWLLLVSGWAKRMSFVWAVLPPLAIALLEKIVFHTSYIGSALKYRLVGGFSHAFSTEGEGSFVIDSVSKLDPLRFLSTPGLWIGLAIAAAFMVAAVRLRRYQEAF